MRALNCNAWGHGSAIKQAFFIMQNRFLKFRICPKVICQFEMCRAVIWRKLNNFLKVGNRVFQILIFWWAMPRLNWASVKNLSKRKAPLSNVMAA